MTRPYPPAADPPGKPVPEPASPPHPGVRPRAGAPLPTPDVPPSPRVPPPGPAVPSPGPATPPRPVVPSPGPVPPRPVVPSPGPAVPAGGAGGGEQVPLLETRGLTKHFKVGGALSRRTLHAVDGADLAIGRREIVALVGESGSGKSTIARLLARVYRPTAGEILYQGRPLSAMRTRRQSLGYRSDVPMVFQDPFSSLNPAYRVAHGLMRGLKLHRPELDRAGRRAEAERVVEAVGLTPAAEILNRYPHELSGGQRQRIGFAQALAYRPTLIIADEPVSMLDVSIRIGLLNVMAALRADEGVSFLYITHDIASARYLSDRLLVMYAGHIVESGRTEDVLARPKHPYTRLLVSAVPDPKAPLAVDASDRGEPPRVINPVEGCRFLPRCRYAIDTCAELTPTPRPVGVAHTAACHVAEPDAAPASAPPGRRTALTAHSPDDTQP